VLIGINDANGSGTPSGYDSINDIWCTGAACNGFYKGNMQTVVDDLNAAGITPIIAHVAPRFGDPFSSPYPDPATHARNLLIRDEYNVAITSQLTGNYTVGPNFYDYFLGSENRFYLYATNLHPNALGYYVMAHMWSNHLTGGVTAPFVVNGFCLKLTLGGACESMFPYKQNLLEVGNAYYADQSYTLTGSIPAELTDGRWIMTRDEDRNLANSDYLTFTVPQDSTLYVAFDADATLPGWMSGYTEVTGVTLSTDNTAVPNGMQLYRLDNVSGPVTLGGADDATTGAAANYVVIVVENAGV
jgi:hypothetical protein